MLDDWLGQSVRQVRRRSKFNSRRMATRWEPDERYSNGALATGAGLLVPFAYRQGRTFAAGLDKSGRFFGYQPFTQPLFIPQVLTALTTRTATALRPAPGAYPRGTARPSGRPTVANGQFRRCGPWDRAGIRSRSRGVESLQQRFQPGQYARAGIRTRDRGDHAPLRSRRAGCTRLQLSRRDQSAGLRHARPVRPSWRNTSRPWCCATATRSPATAAASTRRSTTSRLRFICTARMAPRTATAFRTSTASQARRGTTSTPTLRRRCTDPHTLIRAGAWRRVRHDLDSNDLVVSRPCHGHHRIQRDPGPGGLLSRVRRPTAGVGGRRA